MAWKSLTIDSAALQDVTLPELQILLETLGTGMESYAKQSMKGGGGRVYVHRGHSHQASAPGNPPAVDTGRLRASLTHEVETSGTRVTLRFGTNVKYGLYLELGTRKMAARPFIRPTLDAVNVI
jgi:phage gpG-like protein